MNASSRRIQRVYLFLLLLHTLAASFIWGINTLFLLDAGLSNMEAFAANAFFTAGMVIFEIPTGVLADTRGRRTSYLLGTLTLAVSTLLYLLMWRLSAPFWVAVIGLLPHFWTALSLMVVWGLMFAAITPVRQAYLNALIASKERATVLSFDSLLGSSGAVGLQPVLGKVADAWSYPASYVRSAAIQALAIPFVWLARRERAASDAISDTHE